MSDPLDEMLADLQRLAGSPRRTAELLTPLLAEEVAQRFQRGDAPTESGALRDSVRVSVEGNGVRVRSDLPYAQRHPELIPGEAELERLVDRAVVSALGVGR